MATKTIALGEYPTPTWVWVTNTSVVGYLPADLSRLKARHMERYQASEAEIIFGSSLQAPGYTAMKEDPAPPGTGFIGIYIAWRAWRDWFKRTNEVVASNGRQILFTEDQIRRLAWQPTSVR